MIISLLQHLLFKQYWLEARGPVPQTQLTLDIDSKRVDIASIGERQGMAKSRGHQGNVGHIALFIVKRHRVEVKVRNSFFFKRGKFDFYWFELILFGFYAQLAETTLAPPVELMVFRDGERVVSPTSNVNDFLI